MLMSISTSVRRLKSPLSRKAPCTRSRLSPDRSTCLARSAFSARWGSASLSAVGSGRVRSALRCVAGLVANAGLGLLGCGLGVRLHALGGFFGCAFGRLVAGIVFAIGTRRLRVCVTPRPTLLRRVARRLLPVATLTALGDSAAREGAGASAPLSDRPSRAAGPGPSPPRPSPPPGPPRTPGPSPPPPPLGPPAPGPSLPPPPGPTPTGPAGPAPPPPPKPSPGPPCA